MRRVSDPVPPPATAGQRPSAESRIYVRRHRPTSKSRDAFARHDFWSARELRPRLPPSVRRVPRVALLMKDFEATRTAAYRLLADRPKDALTVFG